MRKRYRALAGLRYPAGDAEYEKALAGEDYAQVVVEPGDECKNMPAKSVEAYLAMGRDVIEEIAPAKAAKAKAGDGA